MGAFALAVLAAVPGLTRLDLDNSPERFFVHDARSLREREAFVDLFGDDRRVWVVLEGDLWTRAGMTSLAAVEQAASESAGVVATAGLWSRHRWLEPEWPPGDLESFQERAFLDPLGRAAGWVSPSGETAAILIEMRAAARSRELDALERQVRRAASPAFEVGLAGLPVFERAMDRSQRRLVTVYLPGLLGLAMLLLRLGFGSFRAATAPLALVGCVVLVTLGAAGYSGSPLDMVSVIFVPILFVVVLASAIHLQTGFGRYRADGLAPRDASAATLRHQGRAVIWAALTTGIAFGSFTTSPLEPVRAIGFWLAAGLGFMLLAVFWLYPVLLELRASEVTGALETGAARRTGRSAGAGQRRGAGSLERAVRARVPRLIDWITAHRLAVLCAFGLLTLTALAGAAQLRRDSNLMNYFSSDHPALQSLVDLENAGLAAAAVELLVRLPPETALEDRFRDPDRLDQLALLTEELRTLQVENANVEVRGAVGAGDLYRAAMADVMVDGEQSRSARWLVLGMMQADPDLAGRLDGFLGDDGRAARVSVLVPLRGPDQLDPLLAAIRSRGEHAFPEARISFQGELPLLLAAQRHLLRTLSVSLALTFLCIAAILGVVTRSLAGAARALVPNLWAMLAVFGIMGWAKIPLDSTTVMIAAIVLGLAVDDTLHTLAQLRPPGSSRCDFAPDRSRLTEVFERVASPHVLTSLVLVAGFAVCALSDSLLLVRFGAVTAAGVVAALAGDLVLLPALLAKRTP